MPLHSYDDAGEVLKTPVGDLVEQGEWYVLTSRGLFVTARPEDVTWEEWWRLGQAFHHTATSFKFWVADWLRFGSWRFKEKFAQAQDLFPFWDEQTLMNIQRVGNRLPPSRRREELPFEYHEAVASAQPAQQKVMLERAATDPGVTREVLRDMTRSYEQPNPELAKVEFMASALRRALVECDKAILRLDGRPREYAQEAVEALRKAIRLVEERKHRREHVEAEGRRPAA